MADDISAACKTLEIEQDQIVKNRYEGDILVLLVDYGIGGIKKYRLSPADLAEAKADDDDSVLLSVPAVVDLGFDDLNYRELQELAKDQGIQANQSSDNLRAALENLLDEEE
jgi:hypothetical protein